ncbi:hypothetical protein E3N88_09892 [Mikania micrantha]|uniref:NB-ARC domain-containing protein n=1 Tax=Mikania micrantha TaxID=192012 RepID=A0A5N6PMM8_9ASTR|nr:hypothetical protein E3N88_09892 [Mikania micrantha]
MDIGYVRRWKAALTEVANLTGMVLSWSESDFIAKVVHTINCKLDLRQLSTPAHLTGMEAQAAVISSWLKDEQSNANVLAICGMGGSGKTTMAQHIYNSHKLNFERNSFLEEIGKYYKQPYGLIGLQKQLLGDISWERNITISVVEGTRKIENTLKMKRALVVLDDINDPDELNNLLGTKAFPTQSKIIITTRLLDIHAWFRSISWRCWAHKLKLLNDVESLELIRNPLALKVLGSSLFVSDEDPLKRNSMIEIWRTMKVPQNLWAEGARYAVYILNRVPTKALKGLTPYESIKGRTPNLAHLKVFGCIGYVKTPSQQLRKLDDRTKKMVHLGIEPRS